VGVPAFTRPQLYAHRYELGDVIGRGGMGVVHRAWDTHLHRFVAVKILRALATDDESRARFAAEGRTLAKLNHPGLITLFDAAVEDDDETYLVMELVDGTPLTQRCGGRPMAVREVAAIGAELADALAHVHDHEIVHRDVKPSNVLVSIDGKVKLADFGIAQLLGGATQHTVSGATIGTAAYLSPEQVRADPITVASDIYSFGLVLLEALCGAPVYSGPQTEAALARLTKSPPIDPDLPGPVRDLLTAMTADDPGRRPSAVEVARILRGYLAGSGTVPIAVTAPRPLQATLPIRQATRTATRPATRPVGPPSTSPPPARRRRPHASKVLWVAATIAIAALVLVGFSHRNGAQSSGSARPSPVPTPVVQHHQQAPAQPKAEPPPSLAPKKQGDAAANPVKSAVQQAEAKAKKAAKKEARRRLERARQYVDDQASRLADSVIGGK
jgi:serine/threonine protein kinase